MTMKKMWNNHERSIEVAKKGREIARDVTLHSSDDVNVLPLSSI
jgi:hypothetical protein